MTGTNEPTYIVASPRLRMIERRSRPISRETDVPSIAAISLGAFTLVGDHANVDRSPQNSLAAGLAQGEANHEAVSPCRRDIDHFFKVIAPAARTPSLARCNAAPLANLSHLAAPGLASLDRVL